MPRVGPIPGGGPVWRSRVGPVIRDRSRVAALTRPRLAGHAAERHESSYEGIAALKQEGVLRAG